MNINTNLPDGDCPDELKPGSLVPEHALQKWLRHCGRGIKVYKGSRLVGPENISLGDFSQIDEGANIFAGGGVTIGRWVHLAFLSSISGGGTCRIHDFSSIGAGSRLITGSELSEGGLSNPTVPSHLRAVSRGHIEIHAHALIFTNCVILPNVSIGEGAVVGAGCVISRDLKPWSIYAGNPAVQIGVRTREPILKNAESVLNSQVPPPIV